MQEASSRQKLNDKFILFPEKWFVKTKGEKLYEKIKRKVTNKFIKGDQFEELISKKVEQKKHKINFIGVFLD